MARHSHGVLVSNTLLVRCRKRMETHGTDVFMTKEDRMEFSEQRTLQGLGKKISEHVFSGAMRDGDVAAFGVVRDEKIMDVNVP